MYRLNKTSQIVSVSPDIILREYENLLNQEGLTGGYLPYEGYQISLGECIYHRKPNLLGLKYGGLDEICSAGIAFTPKGRKYKMNQAPRAATGSDLCKVLVGGEKILGTFEEITMRIFPIPEEDIWGVINIKSEEEAKLIFKSLWGVFIRPVFAVIDNSEEITHHKIISQFLSETNLVLLIKLSGMKRMLSAEMKSILEMFKDKYQFSWIDNRFEVQELDQLLIRENYHQDFIEKMSPLVGRSMSSNDDKAERDLINYMSSK